MTKKKLMALGLTVVMSMSTVFSSFAMEKKKIDLNETKAYSDRENYYGCEVYFKEGVPDGWYTEDGMWFYMRNGFASNEARELNGVMNYFSKDGRWIDNSTQEYQDYVNVLSRMREAKLNRDTSWEIPLRTIIDEYTHNIDYDYAKKLVLDYAITYLYPKYKKAESCFKMNSEGALVLDTSSMYYDAEDKIRAEREKLGVKDSDSDEVKVRKIHDYIVNNYDYGESAGGGGLNMCVANGTTKFQCGGYASLFRYLCEDYDLECYVLTGTGQGGPHAWNRVKVNGEWKYIDVTWDDNTSSKRWYLISKSQMDIDHQPDMFSTR
jgi:hypothetical protein